ncbi:hypothetical protein MMPV_006995 [Pyropia vietnamensis]
MSAGLAALLPPLAVLTILSATRLILTTLRRGGSGGGRAGSAGGRGGDGGGGGGGRGATAPTLAQRLAYARTAARLMRVDREFTPADYEALLELDAFGGAVPQGATKEVVESLPVKVLGEDEEGPAAAVTDRDSGGGSSSSSPASSGGGSSAGGSSRRPLGGEVCTVCLDVMSRGDRVMVLDCGHGMHRSCGARWLDVRAVCPVCKGGVGNNSRKRD